MEGAVDEALEKAEKDVTVVVEIEDEQYLQWSKFMGNKRKKASVFERSQNRLRYGTDDNIYSNTRQEKKVLTPYTIHRQKEEGYLDEEDSLKQTKANKRSAYKRKKKKK